MPIVLGEQHRCHCAAGKFEVLPLYYWSSTTNASFPRNALQFFFGGGDFSQFDGKDGRHHFRAVRNAP